MNAESEQIYPKAGWVEPRTANICEDLRARGWADKVRAKTGVPIDAYFSGTKSNGFWTMFRASGGKINVTDYSNASRTMIFNIHTLEWDAEPLKN